MSQVTKIRAKVQNQPADTTGMVTYNHNTYKYRFPESGKHEYELAVDRGGIDWVPIEQDTKAYETLESKVPNAVKAKLEEPSLWEKVKNKILAVINQKEYGGTMNYSNYLQGGGQAPQAPQIGEEELVQLVKEVVSGNQEAIGILEQLLQANPQLKDTVSQIAQSLQQQAQSMKCGGRVKKKALGSKITPKKVMAKGGCPCMFKKVGGRLIEVDSCTGLPVHKSGGHIKKYQNTPGPIEWSNVIYNHQLKYDPSTQKFYHRGNSTEDFKLLNPTELKNITGSQELLKKIYDQGIYKIGNVNILSDGNYSTGGRHSYGFYNTDKTNEHNFKKGYDWNARDGYSEYGHNFNKKLDFATLYKRAVETKDVQLLNWLQHHNNIGYRGQEITYKDGKAQWDPAQNKYVYKIVQPTNYTNQQQNQGQNPDLPQVNEYGQTLGADGKYSGITYGQRNAAAVGMLGSDGKTGMTVEERQAWMNGAGKDYLAQLNGGKGLGFTSAEYTGTARQNKALFDAYKGFQNWSDTQAAQSAPVYTNQQLLDLDQAGVTGLSADDKARYDRLQAYQANRNKALTFNGTQYADEQAYNTAVNTANQTAANKYYADLAQQQNIYNGNRAMATAALSSGVQRRRQAAFDNLSALNSGTLDYSKLSHRDIRDMQRQMRRGKRNGLYGNSDEARDFYAAPGTGMQVPTMAKTYAGPIALTQEQLSATAFKTGGKLNYANYLN